MPTPQTVSFYWTRAHSCSLRNRRPRIRNFFTSEFQFLLQRVRRERPVLVWNLMRRAEVQYSPQLKATRLAACRPAWCKKYRQYPLSASLPIRWLVPSMHLFKNIALGFFPSAPHHLDWWLSSAPPSPWRRLHYDQGACASHGQLVLVEPYLRGQNPIACFEYAGNAKCEARLH